MDPVSLPPDARRRSGAWFEAFPPFLLPLVFINLTGHMALSGGRLTGSLFVLGQGASESLVGVFMALFSVLPVMTSLAIGRWVDRAGAVRVMRVGIALVLVGAWLPVAWLSLPMLFAMAMFIGTGFNVMSVAAQHTVGHLAGDASPSQRLAHFGWFAMGHAASSSLGPFISGLVIDGLGFRAAFAAMALAACVAAFLVATRIRGMPVARTGGAEGDGTASDGSPGQAVARRKPHVLDLLAKAQMRRIYLVNLVAASSWDLFIVMLPVLGHRLGYSASVIGTVFSLFAVGTFTARAFTPWLSRRVTEWMIMRAALVVIMLVYLLLPLASLAPVLMLLGFAFGCAVGMSQPNMLSLLHANAPAGRGGEAVGLRSLLGNGVSVLVPLLFGVALVPFGIASLLWCGAGLFGLGIWPAHRGLRHAQSADRPRG